MLFRSGRRGRSQPYEEGDLGQGNGVGIAAHMEVDDEDLGGEEAGAGFDYFRFGAGWFFALNNMMLSFVVYSAESWDVPLAMQIVCSVLLALFGTMVPLYAARTTMRMGIRQMIMRQFRMESLVVLSTSAAWLFSVYSMIAGDFSRLYFDVVTLLLMLIETGNLKIGRAHV